MNEQLFPFFFCWIEQRQEKQVKEGESCFKQSHGLMSGESNTKKKKKRHFRNNPSTAAPGDSRIG